MATRMLSCRSPAGAATAKSGIKMITTANNRLKYKKLSFAKIVYKNHKRVRQSITNHPAPSGVNLHDCRLTEFRP
jgi:hypothetical protein